VFWVLLGEEIDELEIRSGEALSVELALGKFGGTGDIEGKSADGC
jgi:hypothetical protein